MKLPKLSVVIPGRRTPFVWWKRCLDSVLRFSGEADEIICVDDGTPEMSYAHLEAFVRGDARIKVLYRRNGGLSVARNSGLDRARGEYLAFIDSDDEVVDNIFQICIRQMEESRSDVAVYGVQVVWTQERLQKIDLLKERIVGKLSPRDVKRLRDTVLLNYAWNKIYRRDFLESHLLRFIPKGMPCEDIIFNLSVIMAGSRWVNVPRVGYRYYRTTTTLLSQYRPFNSVGILVGARMWRCYSRTSPQARVLFAKLGEVSESQLLWAEWENINRLFSPYGFRAKLDWIKANRRKLIKECTGLRGRLIKKSFVVFCIYETVYRLLRRWCYIGLIRKWHIRRLYPQVSRLEIVNDCNAEVLCHSQK